MRRQGHSWLVLKKLKIFPASLCFSVLIAVLLSAVNLYFWSFTAYLYYRTRIFMACIFRFRIFCPTFSSIAFMVVHSFYSRSCLLLSLHYWSRIFTFPGLHFQGPPPPPQRSQHSWIILHSWQLNSLAISHIKFWTCGSQSAVPILQMLVENAYSSGLWAGGIIDVKPPEKEP